MPTGTGKGLLMSDLVKDVGFKGASILTAVRRRDLIFQTAKNYEKYHNHKSSIIMGSVGGYLQGHWNQICSIDTIRERMKNDEYRFLKESKVVIVDECHDTNSPSYQNLFDFIGRDKVFIGLTATPFTIGGKPLMFWQDIIEPITSAEARDAGFLVPDLTYSPIDKIDTAGLKIKDGDFKERDLFDRAKDSKIVGNIISTWRKLGDNRPTMMFCVNKEHSMLMTGAFNLEGISAFHIDESTTATERKLAMEGLRTGKYKVISNINTMTTGVDAPYIGTVIQARPTWSEVIYIQAIGRGLRPYKICAKCRTEYGGDPKCFRCGSSETSFEKNNCIILDHAGNYERHGGPFDPRDAHLAEKMTEEQRKKFKPASARNPVAIKTCEICLLVYSPSLGSCPSCGHINKVGLPEEAKGELKLVDEATVRKIQYNKILGAYIRCKKIAQHRKMKENAVWFMLHKSVGDVMFKFEKDLNIPFWVRERILQGQSENYANNT